MLCRLSYPGPKPATSRSPGTHSRTYRPESRVLQRASPCRIAARSGSVWHMDLHPGEEMVFDGHPSWRAVLTFYVSGVVVVAVLTAIAALVGSTGLAIVVAIVA